jgi:hypothetical protein
MVIKGRTTTHTTDSRFYEGSGVFVEHNSEHYRNEAYREKSLQEIMQELKFPEPTPEDAKLEIKAIRPEKEIGMGLHDIYALKLFSDKHIPFRMAFVFHEPQCQKRLLFKISFLRQLIH